MKFILVAAAFIAAVSAQVANLPTCAITCATAAIPQSGGCGITEYACLCRSQGYLTAFSSCLQSSCNSTDLQTASQIGNALCASAGVTLSSATLTPTASGTSASSSAASSASSAASSVASSISASISSAASSASSASASASSASNSSAASSASSASSRVSSASSAASSAASSSSSAGAAPTQGFAWEVLGLGAAAAAALL